MTTPESSAVPRHPKVVIEATTTGVRRPPTAEPLEEMPSASARRRRNQLTIATAMGTYPPSPAPTATRKNARKNSTGERIRLKRMNPTPKIAMPTRISARGPNRSVSQPCSGPRMALSDRAMANAAAKRVRLQPNSSRISTT